MHGILRLMELNTFFYILSANVVISLISLIGLLILSVSFLRGKRISNMFVSFAAGVMLATAVLNVLPEALHELSHSDALMWFMYGIIGSFFLERSLIWHHHHNDESHNIKPTAALVLMGDGVHNFIDGLAIAAAFMASIPLGIAATVAIAAHEIPQELADYSILRNSGLSRRKALVWNLLSALTAVLGGFVGFYVFNISAMYVHYALAITAGIFLYIAVADLIPEMHHSKIQSGWVFQSILFVAGILLMIGITMATPHSHENTDVHDDAGIHDDAGVHDETDVRDSDEKNSNTDIHMETTGDRIE